MQWRLLLFLVLCPLVMKAQPADSLFEKAVNGPDSTFMERAEKVLRVASSEDSVTFRQLEAQLLGLSLEPATAQQLAYLIRYRWNRWLLRNDHVAEALEGYINLDRELESKDLHLLRYRVKLSLASVYADIGALDQSLRIALEAKRSINAHIPVDYQIELLNTIGETYRAMFQYEEAIGYYDQGLALSRSSADTLFMVRIQNNAGLAYSMLGKFDTAQAYLERGYTLAQIDRIFERFYRGSASQPGDNSSGLGLSLVKLLVERLNGEIKVQSTPNERTEFTVYLP